MKYAGKYRVLSANFGVASDDSCDADSHEKNPDMREHRDLILILFIGLVRT